MSGLHAPHPARPEEEGISADVTDASRERGVHRVERRRQAQSLLNHHCVKRSRPSSPLRLGRRLQRIKVVDDRSGSCADDVCVVSRSDEADRPGRSREAVAEAGRHKDEWSVCRWSGRRTNELVGQLLCWIWSALDLDSS